MMGGEAPETCWATHKLQVINLWDCCILLVDLFESYDDARTCERLNYITAFSLRSWRCSRMSLRNFLFPNKPHNSVMSHNPVYINPLNPELNPICYLLSLLAHHFLHVIRIRVKLLTLRLLMSYIYIYIYGAPILDVSRSHTTTQYSR